MSDIFPLVKERLLTAVLVHVNYPTPPTGELREYEVAQLPPDASLTDIDTRLGDGVYRLVGIGQERTDGGSFRRIERDTRTHRVARGLPSLWEDTVKAVIAKLEPQMDSLDVGGRHGDAGRFGETGPMGDRFSSMAEGGFDGGSFHGSQEPIVIPLGGGENFIVARGLPPDVMQQKIDEAQETRRREREEQSMNTKMMDLLMAQIAAATAEKTAAQQRAEETSSKLMEIALGGGVKRGDPQHDDARVRALEETVNSLRRTLSDMEDKSRRDRSEHWEEIDRWKRRNSEMEDLWRAEKRKNEELTAKLAKSDIDAMLAGAKGPGGDSDEEKMQRKMAMFAQLAQGLAPVAGPILAKLGLIGGAPDAQLSPGMDPAGGMPSGDLGGGGMGQ